MNMRTRVSALIIVVTLVVSVISFTASYLFTNNAISTSMKQELLLSLEIADKLISTKIDLLKSEASEVAAMLADKPDNKLIGIMRSELGNYEDFGAFTVFDLNGVVEKFGFPTTPDHLLYDQEYIMDAMSGRNVISTSIIDEVSGELVFYVCVPIDNNRVLSVAIDGLTFSNLVSGFKSSDKGHITVYDGYGITIASHDEKAVTQREDLLYTLKDKNESDAVEFFRKAMTSDKNVGQYMQGREKIVCAYMPVSASSTGWRITVSAPISESPQSDVNQGLMLASLLMVIIGVIASIFVSRPIAEPYTLLIEQKKDLEDLNQAVLDASEAKTNFLANMSHEMRTPLNAVVGLSELSLTQDYSEKEIETNMEKIYSSGVTLLGLVNDILDLSKIESGKYIMQNDEYDIPSLISDTVSLNIIRIGSKEIDFILDVDPKLPSRLYGDELRFKQIMNNLLSNAIKYTKSGFVKWSIRSIENEPGSEMVTIINEVTDSGIGIKEEDIPKIFGLYNQVSTKANRKIEGTGLGLTITSEMVDMLGGKIDVTSTFGEGSTFRVELPQKKVNDTKIGTIVVKNLMEFSYNTHRREQRSSFIRRWIPYARVLVVDDVKTNLDVARGMMKPYGMTVDTVTSGQEAIDLIKAGEPVYDAIFMDHMMPEMDGIEATRIIRETIGTEYAKRIPIIALTANAIVGNEKMFLDHGFQDFFSKPIDIFKLNTIVNKWLRDKDKEKDMTSEEEGKSSDSLLKGNNIPGIDFDSALEMFGDDEEIYIDVLNSYSANTPGILDKMALVDEDHLKDYAILVHGIKGSSRSIGAMHIGDMAEALEKAAKSNDYSYVSENNDKLLTGLREILEKIQAMLKTIKKENPKEEKDEPDPEVLQKLKDGCGKFDIDEVDEAMAELNKYIYEKDGDLVDWLNTRYSDMDLKEISEKLEGIIE